MTIHTPFLAVSIYPLLTSTDIILFYFFFPLRFFFHDALPILLHVQMPFSPEGMTEKREGGEGRPGPVVRIHSGEVIK